MGMGIALGTAIRALIATHPKKAELLAALRFEHQETLALLTASPYPEQTLTAFHAVWSLVGPLEEDQSPTRGDS